MSPVSRFTYFTQRDDCLAWLASPECQRARRAVEKPIAELLARGGSYYIYCAAHRGQSPVGRGAERCAESWNWRESAECLYCGCITRIHFAAEWIERARTNNIAPRLYVTEQLTPLYGALTASMPSVVGSEFVPDPHERAKASATLAAYLGNEQASIRHEDVCALSFADESLDLIGSFDVLEHVPDSARALTEFFRVLRVGGQPLLTVPFLNAANETLVRAQYVDGALRHLAPPEYHGNPTIVGEGVLCFYHFGWDLLDQLRAIGFRSAALIDAWGCETGVFGDQSAVVATE